MSRNPASILFNTDGYEVAVLEDGYIESTQPGIIFAGKDENGFVKFFSITSDGLLKVTESSRTVLGEYYFGSTFITGTAATQTLLTLENPSGSGITIYLNKIIINGVVGTTFTAPFLYTLARTTGLPTGGTTQTAQLRDSNDISPIGVVRTSPTATPATGSLWTGSPGIIGSGRSFVPNLQPAVATFEEQKEIVIAPGEAVVITAGVNSTNWRHWINLHWNEVAI